MRALRFYQYRMAAHRREGTNQVGENSSGGVSQKFVRRTASLGGNDLECDRIVPHPQADGAERGGQRSLVGAVTTLDIAHLVSVTAGSAGNHQIEAANFLAFDSEWMPPGQRSDARAI